MRKSIRRRITEPCRGRLGPTAPGHTRTMSLHLAIPRQIALPQRSPPIHQAGRILQDSGSTIELKRTVNRLLAPCLTQRDKVIATVPIQWTKLPTKARSAAILTDGTKVTEVEFEGRNEAAQISQ